MSTKCPEIISADNLSLGWGKVFLRLMQPSSKGIAPILLSIGGFANGQVEEDAVIRDAVDGELAKLDKCCSCAISAMTIFPYKHWQRLNRPPRDNLFQWYLNEMLPRLKARDQRNRNGTYFERMICFQGTKRVNGVLEMTEKNQLEHIISVWHRDTDNGSRSRQSALQVSCFDPAKDHTGQKLRGFPCLQQISFGYDNEGGMSVSAYYPTQYISIAATETTSGWLISGNLWRTN
jgi:hypothetical protein